MDKNMPRTPFSTPLSGSAKLTEMRLRNIFSEPKKRPPALFLALMFSVCIFCGNLVSCQVSEPDDTSAQGEPEVPTGGEAQPAAKTDWTPAAEAARYYEADSLPLFQIAYSHLSGEEQSAWLEKIYGEDKIAFFSTLTGQMSETDLENWLDRALEDGKIGFQAMLFQALALEEKWDDTKKDDEPRGKIGASVWDGEIVNDRREKDPVSKRDEWDEDDWSWADKWDEKEAEWEKAQLEEYQSVGVTKNGKSYYYQGQLVNIFLDIRPNKSVYTLDMDPAGTVNVKILRDANNKIIGAAYMTEAEAAELLEDMRD